MSKHLKYHTSLSTDSETAIYGGLRAVDQGPGWWVAGSGLRPWRIPELEEVQALTLRFQGGVRAPALKPPSRGLRMRLGQQGLPPGAGRGGAFPRLLLPLQPGLWGC